MNQDKSPRYFVYKMTTDAGAAPCVQGGLLSLAICKPEIRKSAKEDSILFGFAANSLHADNRLIYIAKISEVVPDGTYYRRARFRGRPDRIYVYRHGRYARRKDALFHDRPGDLTHDLGAGPEYSKAIVLLSNDFRYFGGSGTARYKKRQELRALIEDLRQGHRVNHDPALQEALRWLKDTTWNATTRRVIGNPTSEPEPNACHRGGTIVIVCS